MNKTPSVLDRYPEYEVVIGIEVHVQLTTKSKIFCSCPNSANALPNSNICIICTGHPGTLPSLNRQVVDYAILAGLATNCNLAPICSFDRKHYFYPDLPKGYQITQQYQPICTKGYVPIYLEDGTTKHIRLTRIHIEEDAGKNTHLAETGESLVDLNRAGTPLLEVVSEPDIASAYEARTYLATLRSIVRYLGICSGNMQEGAFRADTNISVRKKGDSKLGTKCELKNINSFKFIGDAIEHEIERQIELLSAGERIKQETRSWDPKTKKTEPMRSKEEAADYRYFPEPDLPFVEISSEWIGRLKEVMPELPQAKAERFVRENGLTAYEAAILVDDLELAHYYEKASALNKSKQVVNWILRDLMGYVNDKKITLADCKMSPEYLAQLITLLENGTINNLAAKQVFDIVAQSGQNPQDVVKEHGLEQLGASPELEAMIRDVVVNNPDVVAQYKSGKDKLIGFFVGQVMQKTAGKGNPKLIQDLLKKHL